MKRETGRKAQHKLVPNDLFDIRVAVNVAASPDGRDIAYICEQADAACDAFQRSLWLVNRDSLETRQVKLIGNAVFCCWSPNGSLIVVVNGFDAAEDVSVLRLVRGADTTLIARLPTVPNAIALSRDGRQLALRMVVPDQKVTVALPDRPADASWSERAFYTERVDWRLDGVGVQDGYAQVFRLDLTSGRLEQLTHGMTPSGYYSAGLDWSHDAASILFVSNLRPDWHKEPFNTNIYALEIASRQITCLTTRFGVDLDPKPSPDGSWIAYRGFDDNGEFHGCPSLYLMGPDGSGAFCLADVGQGIGNHVWAADGSGLYISYVRDQTLRLAFVDLGGTRREIACDLAEANAFDIEPYLIGNASLASVPGGVVTIMATPLDPNQVVEVSISGAQRTLTRMNHELLDVLDLGRTESLQFTSSDGTVLPTWIIFPPDHDPAKTYPMILELHGGPTASYGAQFSYRFQRYAAMGYVVVAPNYRGSLGLDMGFYTAGQWVFPSLEYDDVMAAVDAVMARCKIDPNRLYVTGVSAGGLLSAWVIGKTDRFAASVVQSPLINYISHFLTHDLYSAYVGRYFPTLPWEDPLTHWAQSPLSLIANVTTPALIIQGDQDSRTPLSEGLQLYHALKLRDVPAALLILPGAFHVPTRPVQLLEEQEHILRWFQRFEKGQPDLARIQKPQEG